MDVDRVAFLRRQLAHAEQRAAAARTPEMRRAWFICAREWSQMAIDAELKELADAPKLVPEAGKGHLPRTDVAPAR